MGIVCLDTIQLWYRRGRGGHSGHRIIIIIIIIIIAIGLTP